MGAALWESIRRGYGNFANGCADSIQGGRLNSTGDSLRCSISGWVRNRTSNVYTASVSGGKLNRIEFYLEFFGGSGNSISRGLLNDVRGLSLYGTISGGEANTIHKTSGFGSIAGGLQGELGQYSGSPGTRLAPTIAGGSSHISLSTGALVSGGANRTASGFFNWRAGSLFQNN
jgi:hypothetical protein